MESISEMRTQPDDSGSEPGSLDCLHFCLGCVSHDSWGESGEEGTQHNLLSPCCPAEGSVEQEAQRSLFEYSVSLDEHHNMADCPVSSSVIPVTHRPRLSFTPVSRSAATLMSTVGAVVIPLGPGLMTDTCGPISFTCSPTAPSWDTLRSTSRAPGGSDGDPVSAAAHLHLLGESLSLIGLHLQGTNKVVCVSSSLSLLLDSLLCALAPLFSLTAQIPELRSCSQHSLASTLENINYLMPGL